MQLSDRVGFVGLGRMGEPMAARLCASGFRLRVLDRRPEVASAFAEAHGAEAAASLDDLAAGVDVLVTMLPDDEAVRAVMKLAGGHLRAGSLAIDMGSSSPSLTMALAGEFAARGIGYVDAPVMGGVVFARDGSLDVMAGGRDADVQRGMPLLSALGRQVLRCAGPGSGHALKALGNFVNAAALAAMLEAMTIGRTCGMSSEFLADAFAKMCTGRQHPLEKKVVPHVLTGRFATGMQMSLIAKDVSIAAGLARDRGAPSPMASETARLWREASARFGPGADQTEIARWWTDPTGVQL